MTDPHAPAGVTVLAEFGPPTLRVRVGATAAALRGGPGPGVLLLAVDGSAQADPGWAAGAGGVSPVAELVYAIARHVHQAGGGPRAEVVCGFLSCDAVRAVPVGVTAAAVEAGLRADRAEYGLRHRGAFLRPTAAAAERRFAGRSVRVCVLGDGDVFDADDVDAAWTVYGLRGTAGGRVALLADGVALDEHFGGGRDALRRVVVRLDRGFPLGWLPAGGRLTGDPLDGPRLEFDVPDEPAFEAVLHLPGWAGPRAVTVAGVVGRAGGEAAFRVRQPVTRVPPVDPPGPPTARGRLGEADLAAWRAFGTPGWRCPGCGAAHARLVETPPHGLRPRPVFRSVAGPAGGYAVLEAGAADWVRFETGADLGPVAVVCVDGAPHAVAPDGSVSPCPGQDAHYWFEADGRRFFVLPL